MDTTDEKIAAMLAYVEFRLRWEYATLWRRIGLVLFIVWWTPLALVYWVHRLLGGKRSKPPFIVVDSRTGTQVVRGGCFESPEGPAKFLRLEDVVHQRETQNIGVIGVFEIERTGRIVKTPLLYNPKHPSYPRQTVLFIMT